MKTARPKAAETPQQNVAAAMNRYPRIGCATLVGEISCCVASIAKLPCLWAEPLFNPLGVKTDQYLVSRALTFYHHCRRRSALVRPDQLEHCLLVRAHVPFFIVDSSRREEGLEYVARRSTGLCEDYHFLLLFNHDQLP